MSDVFAGLKLSEAATARPASVDQRLFSPPTKPPKVTDWRDGLARPETKPPESPPPATSMSAEASIPIESARIERPLMDPTAKVLALFELNEKATHKVSFLFTDVEFDRLDDLKLELRRRFALDAIKNDIVRIAIQLVCEDYSKNPEKSALVKALSKKAS